jgi:hypothetical protein
MSNLRQAAQQALEALEGALETMKSDWHLIDNEFVPSEGGLEAVIDGRLTGYEYFQETIVAITALKAALSAEHGEQPKRHVSYVCPQCYWSLEQTEQAEPVAWLDSDGFPWSKEGIACRSTPDTYTPLYTHPPRREWRGLKEWEINDGLDQLPTEDVCSWSFRKGVYFAEAALKERNA